VERGRREISPILPIAGEQTDTAFLVRIDRLYLGLLLIVCSVETKPLEHRFASFLLCYSFP